MRGRNLLDAIHNEFRFPIIIMLIIILFVNASGKINIDMVLDRTPEENINMFINSIDNINPGKSGGEVKTGMSIYDDNRILYPMMYKMGQREYLLYLFTGDFEVDDGFNKLLSNYMETEDSLDVYVMKSDELIDTVDSYLYQPNPVILKMTRNNSVSGEKPITTVTGIFTNEDEFKEVILKDKVLGDTGNEKTDNEVSNEVSNEVTNEVNSQEKEKKGFFDKFFKNGELR